MNTKKICRVFAACLALSMASSAYAEDCIPALVVIRHAEDNKPGTGEKHLLETEGVMHAKAYSSLFRYTSSKWIANIPPYKNICPIKTILSSWCSGNCGDNDESLGFSTNPYQTVFPLLKKLKEIGELSGLTIQTKDKDGIDFKDDYRSKDGGWANNSFLSLLQTKPGQSTLLSFSKEALWSSSEVNHAGRNGLLMNLLNPNASDFAANKSYIDKAGEPHFNWLYIFKGLQPDNRFNEIGVYMQIYHVGKDSTKLECIADLHKYKKGFSEIEIAELYKIPENGYKPLCNW